MNEIWIFENYYVYSVLCTVSWDVVGIWISLVNTPLEEKDKQKGNYISGKQGSYKNISLTVSFLQIKWQITLTDDHHYFNHFYPKYLTSA